MAVSGTFQRRSHPVNPLSLEPTPPPPTPTSFPPFFTTFSTPHRPSLSVPLSLIVGPSSRLSLSDLVRLKRDTVMSKSRCCENEIKGQVPPTRTPIPPAPRPKGSNPPKYSTMKANIVMSRFASLQEGKSQRGHTRNHWKPLEICVCTLFCVGQCFFFFKLL